MLIPNQIERLEQWHRDGKEALAASPRVSTINDATRSLDVVWFTSIDVQRYDWSTDKTYMLRFDPKGADLSLLNNGAPVCDNHLMESVAHQLGVVERAWVQGTNYLATLRFSKRPAVDGLWQDIKDKVVQKLSMGVEILDVENLGQQAGSTVRLAKKWRPFELSIAPLPADFGTTTLTGQANEKSVHANDRMAHLREISRGPTNTPRQRQLVTMALRTLEREA